MKVLGESAERVDTSASLRRRLRREQAEHLVQRAAVLPDPDRILVELALREGRPVADIAAVRGVPYQVLRRHLNRILRRLVSDEFIFVSRQLSPPHGECPWSSVRRRVAQACVLHGLSMRRAARVLNLSLHTVRKHRHALAAMVESVRSRGERP